MSTKIITLDDHFSTGEPTVQLVSTWGRNGRLLRESTSLQKIASINSPAVDYIKNVTPEPGKSIVLIVGLGDHETYGPNRNGDGFPSEPVPGKIAEDEVLTKHYKSYKKAHVFRHHVNGDPAKAIGRVKEAFWNPRMRRVEVLEDFDHSKAPDLLEKIAAGEYPSKSMGCFPQETQITTENGRVAIQQIRVGDTVLTHTGKFCVVTETHIREYQDTLFSIKTILGRVSSTKEHPFLIIPKKYVEERVRSTGVYYYRQRRDLTQIDPAIGHWISAKNLHIGMYVAYPFDSTEKQTLTTDECRILGYYGAEGWCDKEEHSNTRVNFAHHITDVLPVEIKQIAHKLNIKVSTRKTTHSIKCNVTYLTSKYLRQLCLTHVGKYAKTKRLSLELMQQPIEQQLTFLGAYLNGDGHYDKKLRRFTISTANEELAQQLKLICLRCGIYARIQKLNVKPHPKSPTQRVAYALNISGRYAKILKKYSSKGPVEIPAFSSTGKAPILVKGALITQISEINQLEFCGNVYNLEVKTDHSFVADGVAVHNCRIKYDVCTLCGNKAKTRADYCDCLKFEMGKIDSHTGKQAAALNPSPDFFDSSWVIRPADRTGYMLKKVAYARPYEISSFELGERVEDLKEKSAAIGKSADIEKVLDGKVEEAKSHLTDSDIKLLSKYKDTVLPKAKNTKPLKISAIRIIAQFSPGDALETTEGLGMPLGLGELLQYFMSRMAPDHEHDDKITKSANAHVPFILKLLEENPRFCDTLIKESNLFDGQFNPKLASQLEPYLPERATTGDYLARRMLPANLYEGEPLTNVYTWTDPNTGQQYQTNQHAIQQMHDNLSGAAYKRKAMMAAPLLGASALLGTAAMALGRKGFAHRGKAIAAGLGSAATGLYGGYQALKPTQLPGPTIMTDQGKPISGWTEMVRTASADSEETTYMLRRAIDKHSNILTSNKVAALNTAIKTAAVALDTDDTVLGSDLDLEKVATIVGNSIVTQA